MAREFSDPSTGWLVRITEDPDLGEAKVTIADPSTDRTFMRRHNPGRPLPDVQQWVRMIRRADTLRQRSAEAHIRRAARVLAMVHELHKAGFQGLRIDPHTNSSGSAWRCKLAPVTEFSRSHGAEILHPHPDQPMYSSGMDNRYFGWLDVASASARDLAQRFLEHFPEVAAASERRDWEYAGWYSEMMGHAERGAIPIRDSGEWGPPSREGIGTTDPDVVLPMPPPGEAGGGP